MPMQFRTLKNAIKTMEPEDTGERRLVLQMVGELEQFAQLQMAGLLQCQGYTFDERTGTWVAPSWLGEDE